MSADPAGGSGAWVLGWNPACKDTAGCSPAEKETNYYWLALAMWAGLHPEARVGHTSMLRRMRFRLWNVPSSFIKRLGRKTVKCLMTWRLTHISKYANFEHLGALSQTSGREFHENSTVDDDLLSHFVSSVRMFKSFCSCRSHELLWLWRIMLLKSTYY